MERKKVSLFFNTIWCMKSDWHFWWLFMPTINRNMVHYSTICNVEKKTFVHSVLIYWSLYIKPAIHVQLKLAVLTVHWEIHPRSVKEVFWMDSLSTRICWTENIIHVSLRLFILPVKKKCTFLYPSIKLNNWA